MFFAVQTIHQPRKTSKKLWCQWVNLWLSLGDEYSLTKPVDKLQDNISHWVWTLICRRLWRCVHNILSIFEYIL